MEKEQLETQNKLFRELVSELNGKEMDYESCRILEDFLTDYSKGIFEEVERVTILKLEELKSNIKGKLKTLIESEWDDEDEMINFLFAIGEKDE